MSAAQRMKGRGEQANEHSTAQSYDRYLRVHSPYTFHTKDVVYKNIKLDLYFIFKNISRTCSVSVLEENCSGSDNHLLQPAGFWKRSVLGPLPLPRFCFASPKCSYFTSSYPTYLFGSGCHRQPLPLPKPFQPVCLQRRIIAKVSLKTLICARRETIR